MSRSTQDRLPFNHPHAYATTMLLTNQECWVVLTMRALRKRKASASESASLMHDIIGTIYSARHTGARPSPARRRRLPAGWRVLAGTERALAERLEACRP